MTEARAKHLRTLAIVGDMDALEGAWLEALEDPGPAEDFLEALDALEEGRRAETSQSLLPLVLETYEGLERYEDALKIVRRLAELQPSEPALRRALVHHIRQAYRDTDWVEGFLRASGIPVAVPLDEGLRRFDSFHHYKPGAGVEHKAGWGAGIIEGFNQDTWDLRVRFEEGIVRELPLTSAVENLPPLDDGDLRVMRMTRTEELKELAMREPAIAIRKALALRPGHPLTAAKIKEILVDQVVPAEAWSRWWPRAKQAAAKDPYLKVEGGSRPVFQLRDDPLSLEEEAVEKVASSRSLSEAVERVREYFASKPDRDFRALLLEEIRRRVEAGLEAKGVPGDLLDGILLLEEHSRSSPRSSAEVLRDSLSEGGDAAAALESIGSEKGRSLALTAFPLAFPEDWARMLTASYQDLPKDLMDSATDLLLKKGFGAELLAKFRTIMEAPWKAPWPIFYLARRLAGGAFDGLPDPPRIAEAALAMLKCLESSLFHASGTKQGRREVMKRYEELLFDPKRRLLERFFEDGTRDEMVRAMSMVHVTSRVPESIQNEIMSEVNYRHPELKKHVEVPFWEEETFYCTREGIEKKEEELRVITEEKLPKVSEAIGRAASFGDLSENAEWTAALEDQRLLTEKAAQIEAELRNVRILEDQRIPEGMVVPGTRVTLKRVGEDGLETLTLLGPWDVGETGVVSYRAPLAAPLLGKKVGEQVLIELPGKSYEVTVLAVEPVDFKA